jgi:hypothetical protein
MRQGLLVDSPPAMHAIKHQVCQAPRFEHTSSCAILPGPCWTFTKLQETSNLQNADVFKAGFDGERMVPGSTEPPVYLVWLVAWLSCLPCRNATCVTPPSSSVSPHPRFLFAAHEFVWPPSRDDNDGPVRSQRYKAGPEKKTTWSDETGFASSTWRPLRKPGHVVTQYSARSQNKHQHALNSRKIFAGVPVAIASRNSPFDYTISSFR